MVLWGVIAFCGGCDPRVGGELATMYTRFWHLIWIIQFTYFLSNSILFDGIKCLIITHPNKVVGGILVSLCLSVSPSVCPSVWEKVVSAQCTITPIAFDIHWWYFNLLKFWGQKVEGQGQICSLKFASFLHYNSTLSLVSLMTRGRPLLILGSKGGMSRLNLYFEVSFVSADNSFTFWHKVMILETCIDHDPRRISWFWGQKVKGQGQILISNFVLFLHDNSISFLHMSWS